MEEEHSPKEDVETLSKQPKTLTEKVVDSELDALQEEISERDFEEADATLNEHLREKAPEKLELKLKLNQLLENIQSAIAKEDYEIAVKLAKDFLKENGEKLISFEDKIEDMNEFLKEAYEAIDLSATLEQAKLEKDQEEPEEEVKENKFLTSFATVLSLTPVGGSLLDIKEGLSGHPLGSNEQLGGLTRAIKVGLGAAFLVLDTAALVAIAVPEPVSSGAGAATIAGSTVAKGLFRRGLMKATQLGVKGAHKVHKMAKSGPKLLPEIPAPKATEILEALPLNLGKNNPLSKIAVRAINALNGSQVATHIGDEMASAAMEEALVGSGKKRVGDKVAALSRWRAARAQGKTIADLSAQRQQETREMRAALERLAA